MEKLGIKAKEAVNWLEKQGEKPQDKSALETIKGEKVDNQNCVKPADKVEPKFKVGDWIIRSAKGFKHSTYLVTEIKDYYICKTLKGRKVTFTFNDVHENFKLWDISDANDGDVLTWDDTTCVVLFKNIKNYKCFISYCFANNISFKIGTSHYIEGCHPATKEERDILFEKMHEAGYKWLEETKDLMKIEDICMYSRDNYTDEERKILCKHCTESCKYNNNN